MRGQQNDYKHLSIFFYERIFQSIWIILSTKYVIHSLFHFIDVASLLHFIAL